MADSTDMKSKKRQNDLDTDLDALLDEAELSITPSENLQEDDDAIDRLLMDAGFEADEKLPENIDDTAFPAGYDEFGDDFDLADISTDIRNSDAEINLAGDLKADHDFPLELIESIAITSDEKPNAFIATDDDDELEVFPLNGLQNDELEQAEEAVPVFDDSHLTDKLDEFSDFNDFQQAELIADELVDASYPAVGDDSELHDMLEQTPEPPAIVIDEDELIVDIAELEAIDQAIEHDEFGDDLDDQYGTVSTLESAAQTDKNRQHEDEQTTSAVNNGFGIPSADFDITADFDDDLIDNLEQADDSSDESSVQKIDLQATQPEPMIDEPIIGKVPEKSPDNGDSQIDAAGIAALMQFKSDQEAINKKYKKQIADFETNAKKSAIITYAAVGFGVTSLITAVVMGVMAYSAKTEITKLTELTTALGKDKSGIVDTQNQHPEIIPKGELNHEADKTMEDSKHKPETTSPEIKPDHAAAKPIHEAENTAHDAKIVAPDSPAPSTSIEQAPIPSAPLKHEKPETIGASHKTANKPVEQQKENVEALTKKTSLSEALPTSADSKKIEIPAVPEKKQVSEHKPVEHQERKAEVIDKHKRPITTSKKTAVKTKQKIVTPVSDWSVNLIAYKQQWYASSKAAEFAQKGVPVEILPVKINNVTWYRLRVGGFNNKEEASLYAGRVKKALNLSSVWVGK